jgi:hypothetical protein
MYKKKHNRKEGFRVEGHTFSEPEINVGRFCK